MTTPRFELHDHVKIIGDPKVWTVEVRHDPDKPDIGTKYTIELGGDFSTRIVKEESELELVERPAVGTEGGPGFVPKYPLVEN